MIRLFDILFSFTGLTLGSPLLLSIYLVGLLDTGSPLFRQTRLGKDKKAFTLIKFRTMHINTRSIASHLADSDAITPIGRILRKTKLDELPQLWNVLVGDMSLVGPRPNLPNQIELISERDKLGVYNVKPGITGLAQIQNIDMSTPEKLALVDLKMVNDLRLKSYFKYILQTVLGRGAGDAVQP